MDLPIKYRPKSFKTMVGQEDAIEALTGMFTAPVSVPKALLFTGPSGTGKTTLARIVASKLNVGPHDLHEVDGGQFRGIDTIRDIRTRAHAKAISGDYRCWILDEVHQLSKDGQHALLKVLEEPPSHVYFMLATTHPHQLLPTIRNRCTTITLNPVSETAIRELIDRVLSKENRELSDKAIERIMAYCGNSPRQALVILNQVMRMKNEKRQLDSICKASVETQAIELARALLGNAPWPKITALLKAITEDPESLRRMILGYCSTVALGNGRLADRAVGLIDCFQDNYFDSGKAGLIASCRHAIRRK